MLIVALMPALLASCTGDDEPSIENTRGVPTTESPVVVASSIEAATSCEQLAATYVFLEADRIAAAASTAGPSAQPTATSAPPDAGADTGTAEEDADAVAARLGCEGPETAAMVCEQALDAARAVGDEDIPAVCR